MLVFSHLNLLIFFCLVTIDITLSSITNSGTVDEKICSDANGICESNNVNCEDQYRLCLFWAQAGECVNNKAFMSSHCPQSCEVCTGGKVRDWDQHENKDPDCNDTHSQCEFWASEGECVANPGYMMRSCRLSCNVCVNIKSLREKGIDELEILQRYRYANMQWGSPQDGDSEIQEKVKLKAILMAMKKYALYNVTLFPLEGRRNCHNLHSNCGVRAANGECDTHFSEMITSCPLVCQLCHQKSIYEKCSLANLSSPLQPYLLSSGIEQVFQHLLSMEGSKLLTKASDIGVGNPIDTWILRWDNLFSHKDIEDLVALTRTLGWKHSRPIATNSIENFGVIRCQSRSASCDEMCQTEHGIYRKVLEILADLLPGDAISYMEPLEFIYFDEMESCAEHHDFSREDKWMIPGPRVLSLALTLTVPSEGGALGFPKLDWLSIPPSAGQFLLWPNVLSSDPNKPNLMMTSEALPPIVGQKFIIKTSVRLYKYQEAIDRGCVR